jgi:hypothetical protein
VDLYGVGLLALLCLADYFGRNLEQLRSVGHPKLLALWQTQAIQTIPFYALFWLGLVPGVLLLAPFPVFSNGGLQGQDVAKEIFLAICWLVFAVRAVGDLSLAHIASQMPRARGTVHRDARPTDARRSPMLSGEQRV